MPVAVRENCNIAKKANRQSLILNNFENIKMTPSEQCKQAGLKSLAELVRTSGVSEQTLINWHRDKPILFELLICGALYKKNNTISS